MRRRDDDEYGGCTSLGAAHSMIGPLTDQQRRRAEGELSTLSSRAPILSGNHFVRAEVTLHSEYSL